MQSLRDVFHELGDPTRLRVLSAILGARKNVSQVVDELGLAQPQVSYHLRKLREAGLAVEERDGRWVWYQAFWDSPDTHVRELLDLMMRWDGGAGAPERRGRRGTISSGREAPGGREASAERPAASEPRPALPEPSEDLDDYLL